MLRFASIDSVGGHCLPRNKNGGQMEVENKANIKRLAKVAKPHQHASMRARLPTSRKAIEPGGLSPAVM